MKITTGRGDDYATGCLLDYNYSKKYCKIRAVDLSKQQALDANPKQYTKLILLEIWMVIITDYCFSLLER